jgi:Trypsin-like peptidase domain
MSKRRESFEAVQKSVVRVKDHQGATWGTGFFINKTGHLLTCAHVVEDAGGWKNVRIQDLPVTCLYEGDPDRDDICLLQVEDYTPPIYAELGTDFDDRDEFLSFGFSNDDFYGAPIRGRITAFARCGKLGDQKLIRLETFSDAQRIEGGQSGAPVFVYKRGKWVAVGLIAASEDLQGGLAIPSNSIQSKLAKIITTNNKKPIAVYAAAGLAIAGLVASSPWIKTLFLDPCHSPQVNQEVETIANSFRDQNPDYKGIEIEARKLTQRCPYKGYYFEAKALEKQKNYTQAIKLFEESLRLQKSPEAKFGLASNYGFTDQYIKAIEVLSSLEKEALFSKEFDPSSKLNERNLKHNLAVFHHLLVSENFKGSELLEADKRNHLKEALKRYQENFKQTSSNSCGNNSVGECVDQYRAWSADGIAQVYALMYGMNRDKQTLKQSIFYLNEGFSAKSQLDRQNDLSLLEAPVAKESFQKDLSYITSESDFKQFLKTWKQQLQAPGLVAK